MRVANLMIVAFCAVAAMFGVAQSAELRPVCGSDLTATIGPPPDALAPASKSAHKAARLCPIGCEEHPKAADLLGGLRDLPRDLLGRRGVVHLGMLRQPRWLSSAVRP